MMVSWTNALRRLEPRQIPVIAIAAVIVNGCASPLRAPVYASSWHPPAESKWIQRYGRRTCPRDDDWVETRVEGTTVSWCSRDGVANGWHYRDDGRGSIWVSWFSDGAIRSTRRYYDGRMTEVVRYSDSTEFRVGLGSDGQIVLIQTVDSNDFSSTVVYAGAVPMEITTSVDGETTILEVSCDSTPCEVRKVDVFPVPPD